jgi:trk system potassium uptake protein TrkH
MSRSARRPGDRVVRRPVRRTQVISLPGKRERPDIPNVRRHSKLFAAVLLGLILFSAFLLATPVASRSGESTPFVDALFTAVSAACVTGLVTVDTRDHWNVAGQAVILLLIQAGGLGFMVGASLILRMLQRGQIGLRETLLLQDGAPTLSLREAAELSRRIVVFTFAVEGAGALVLALRFMRDMPVHLALWHGVFHSVSAFCNAGFDLQGGFVSLTTYQSSWVVGFTIMSLIQLGGISYVVFADMAEKRRWRDFALETKLVIIINYLLVFGVAALFLASEWDHALRDVPLWDRPLVAVFQSVSARTAGYASITFAELQNFTLFVWILAMFIGGASGSTAGGVKLTTVGVIAVAVYSTIRGQMEPQVFARRIPTSLIFRAMAVVFLMFAAHFVTTSLLAIAERTEDGPQFIALFFEAMSALATVGLTTGITPLLSTESKLILCLAMIFGRLGPLTAVYALQRHQHAVRYRFPEAPVRIG